jgi:uncharacterized cupredoxin-like copper-binding protein
MSGRRLMFGALVVCAVLVNAACGGGNADGTPGPTMSHDMGRIVHMKLTDKMTFEPATFTLKTNQQVDLELENTGTLKHNFSIDSLKINQDVAPGAKEHVVFTAPDKPGQVPFYCNVPGHREAGMVGTLVIEQQQP